MTNETEIIPYEPTAVTLFRTEEPKAIIARASEIATALSGVLRERKLTTHISGKEHVRVEGWTLLGSMLGVFPVCLWSRSLPDEAGWEARVEARTMNGAVVGAAEASCTRSEKTWAHRDDFALRSMAQTRATSKALRLPLGFVVAMAGYEPTPSEEMPEEMPEEMAMEGAGAVILPSQGIRVSVVREKPFHDGKGMRYQVEFSDGIRCSTFDSALATMAMAFRDGNIDVEYTTEQKGKYTNLTGLRAAYDEPPNEEEGLPF